MIQGKRGRNSLREIKRAGGKRYEQVEKKQQLEKDNSVGASSADDGESENENFENSDPKQAYNALITLLGDEEEEPEEKQKNQKKQKRENLKKPSEDNIDEEIEEVEEEEEEEEVIEENEQSDDEEDSGDPFEYHINSPDESYLDKLASFSNSSSLKWTSLKQKAADAYNILQTELSTAPRTKPKISIKSRISTDNLKISSLAAGENLQQAIFSYKDVVFPYKEYSRESSLRELYCVHAVNHIFKTRDKILKNNMKLANYKDALINGKTTADKEPELRDQGFNRAKVLILLPTKESCYDVVNKIIKVSSLPTVENKKRFVTQYHSDSEVPVYKPEDFKYLFKGNSNDFFCLGMKMTRKTLKLYSAFTQSDIILASPLGLKTIVEKKGKSNKEFLSSIEVLILDQANSLQYQNWSNVSYILKHVNKIPESYSDDLDFSRIRMWAINNQFKYIRQNLVFCKFMTPEISSVIGSRNSLNSAGKVKFNPIFNASQSAMGQIVFKVKQQFQRFACENPVNEPSARFSYFTSNIVPQLKEDSQDKEAGGTLVFIPEYNDYLRVKHYLKYETSVNFCSIDEYSSQSKLTKYRDGFNKGQYKVMLYTERLHHYNRFEIRGVKNIVFYKCPYDSSYYTEIVLRFLGNSMMKEVIKDIMLSRVKIVYCQWDGGFLERVVGSEKVGPLCFGPREVYEFR